jgi:mono/diheme cytochrome c family protein
MSLMQTPKPNCHLRRVVALTLATLASTLPASAQPPAPRPTLDALTYRRDVLPILMGKCSRCHHPGSLLGNWLDYPAAFAHRAAIERRTWTSWKGRYYKEPMPVADTAECQAMTAQERAIIKQWVEAGAPRGAVQEQAGPKTKAEKLARGKHLFTTICALCHQPNARGVPGKFPPLAASDFLNADKSRAISTVLHGRQGPVVVNGRAFNNSMPTLPLTDEQVADVLTFVYHSFGNSGKQVTAQEVKVVRSRPVTPENSALAMRRAAQPPPPDNNPYE